MSFWERSVWRSLMWTLSWICSRSLALVNLHRTLPNSLNSCSACIVKLCMSSRFAMKCQTWIASFLGWWSSRTSTSGHRNLFLQKILSFIRLDSLWAFSFLTWVEFFCFRSFAGALVWISQRLSDWQSRGASLPPSHWVGGLIRNEGTAGLVFYYFS